MTNVTLARPRSFFPAQGLSPSRETSRKRCKRRASQALTTSAWGLVVSFWASGFGARCRLGHDHGRPLSQSTWKWGGSSHVFSRSSRVSTDLSKLTCYPLSRILSHFHRSCALCTLLWRYSRLGHPMPAQREVIHLFLPKPSVGCLNFYHDVWSIFYPLLTQQLVFLSERTRLERDDNESK